MAMFTKIRHVAIYTENYDRMAKFYQTILGWGVMQPLTLTLSFYIFQISAPSQ